MLLEDALSRGVVEVVCQLPFTVLDTLWLVVLIPAYPHTIAAGHVAVGIILVLVGTGLLNRVRPCARFVGAATVGPGGRVLIFTQLRVVSHIADRVVTETLHNLVARV